MTTSKGITEIKEFKICGIAVRTTNQNGQSQKDIGNLWGKFMNENIIGQISDKVTQDIYCIYTDYESDVNGPYTTIIGCKVNSFEIVPEGFVCKVIPSTTYRQFQSQGKLPDCVADTWRTIWQLEMERKYIADFDLYGERSHNPEHAEVDTFVSIK